MRFGSVGILIVLILGLLGLNQDGIVLQAGIRSVQGLLYSIALLSLLRMLVVRFQGFCMDSFNLQIGY
jgi:hypothetical protein